MVSWLFGSFIKDVCDEHSGSFFIVKLKQSVSIVGWLTMKPVDKSVRTKRFKSQLIIIPSKVRLAMEMILTASRSFAIVLINAEMFAH